MLKKSMAALVLCLGLVCCATAPAGVPRGANVEFPSLKDGWAWNWHRTLEHGCADFKASVISANVRGMDVRLSVDPSRCGGGNRTSILGCESCGPGFWYLGDSYMFFQNYYSWTAEYARPGPCPYSLSPEQLAALRVVAHEAIAEATTYLERRTLEHIDQILAATDGAALISAQHGCSPDVERGPFPAEEWWRQ